MVRILTGYFIFSVFVDDKNPQSTEWLKILSVGCNCWCCFPVIVELAVG